MAFAFSALIATECGYRLGYWWKGHTQGRELGAARMIVGSLLALMAFLLAITVGMATDRFDKRHTVVPAEANAVGTAYLRAGYLPEPVSGEVRALLREYLQLRIAAKDPDAEAMRWKIARSVELHAELWSIAEELARTNPQSDVLALFIESLNEMIDLHLTRVTVGVYGRVPETVLLLLLVGTLLTLSMVGYNAGLNRRRTPFTTIVLVVLLGAVITLVFDLDRPQGGFLMTSQQPLIDLQQQIGAP